MSFKCSRAWTWPRWLCLWVAEWERVIIFPWHVARCVCSPHRPMLKWSGERVQGFAKYVLKRPLVAMLGNCGYQPDISTATIIEGFKRKRYREIQEAYMINKMRNPRYVSDPLVHLSSKNVLLSNYRIMKIDARILYLRTNISFWVSLSWPPQIDTLSQVV